MVIPWLKSTAPSLSSARMMSGVFTLSAWKTGVANVGLGVLGDVPLEAPLAVLEDRRVRLPVFQYTDGMLTMLVSGAPAIAALKMLVCVARNAV
jgi:hypothetical protein